MNRNVISISICILILLSTTMLKSIWLFDISASPQNPTMSSISDKCSPDIVSVPLINLNNSTEMERMFERINSSVPFQPVLGIFMIQNVTNTDSLTLVGKTSSNITNLTIGNSSLENVEKGIEIHATGGNITADNIKTKTIEILSNLIRINCEPGGLVILLPPVDEKIRAMYSEGSSYLTRLVYVEGNVLTKTVPTDCMHIDIDCNVRITDTIPSTVTPFAIPAAVWLGALLAIEYCHHHDCNPFE